MDPSVVVGPVTTRMQVIGNFDSFILNNIPYAQVTPDHVRWGSVYYDGPEAPGINGSKPALQWHFGGVPYPISKAIRIPYTYVRTWDGSDTIVPASIFIGFQQNLTELILPQALPWVWAPSNRFRQNATSIGTLGNSFWASDAALLASEAPGLVTKSMQYDSTANNTLHEFVRAELNDDARFANLETEATPIDLDGLAKDNDSSNVFQYMVSTVVNDPAAYARLLHWYFGGKAYSLTKVVRIWLDFKYKAAIQGSLVENASTAARTAFKTNKGGEFAAKTGEVQDLANCRLAELQNPKTPTGRALFIGYGGGVSDNG